MTAALMILYMHWLFIGIDIMNIKNRNKNNKRYLIYAGVVVAIVIVVLLITEGVSLMTKSRVTTKEGIEYLTKAENGDVTSIEHKISMLDEKDRASLEGEAYTVNYKVVFSNCVIMGNSIAKGFNLYDYLGNSNVVAKTGVSVKDLEDEIAIVKDLKPGVIFLSYGTNDVELYKENVSGFIKDYKNVIDTINEELPDSKIFVNSIFPVRRDAIDEIPEYQYIDEYNDKLQKMCDDMQVAFLDNTDIVSTEYYEQDGVHFISEFYPLWADAMAQEASLW